MLELIGAVATVLAVTGVLFNNRRCRICFIFWFASNSVTLILHADVGLWSLVVRDAIFIALAVEGWLRWGLEKKA